MLVFYGFISKDSALLRTQAEQRAVYAAGGFKRLVSPVRFGFKEVPEYSSMKDFQDDALKIWWSNAVDLMFYNNSYKVE